MFGNSGIQGDFKGLPFLNWRILKHESSVFAGATGDRHGNNGGANDPYTIFTVTGLVLIRSVFGVVGTSLTGAGEVQVGTADNVLLYLANTEAVNLDANEVYAETADPVDKSDVLVTANRSWYASNGEDIIETISSSNVETGQMDYYVIWTPAKAGANLVSATAVA